MGIVSGSEIGLRNKRKAGYCWVDNEITVCFQPIVGADAVWIYHNLARQVQEQDFHPSVSFALRDMALWSGRSKDTVQRCLAILEQVGLISVRRSTKSKATYDLLDVKELVVELGAVYEARRASFVLPASVTDRLRDEVKALRERLARKAAERPGARTQSVAQSDRLPVDSLFWGGAESDRSVALEDASVAPAAVASSYYKKEKKKEEIPPLPPTSGGRVSLRVSTDVYEPSEEAAADRVMQECGFVRRRLRRVLLATVRSACARGERADEVAGAMIAAWKTQILRNDEGLLRFPFGPERFFGDGRWIDAGSWHWDVEAVGRKRSATTGVWRG